MKYVLQFFFEYGGYCLWAGDKLTEAKFGYPIANEKLPISQGLVNELYSLEKEFQTILNWDNPAAPSPWTEEHKCNFAKRARDAFERLVIELGADFEVKNESNWW